MRSALVRMAVAEFEGRLAAKLDGISRSLVKVIVLVHSASPPQGPCLGGRYLAKHRHSSGPILRHDHGCLAEGERGTIRDLTRAVPWTGLGAEPTRTVVPEPGPADRLCSRPSYLRRAGSCSAVSRATASALGRA